VALVPPANNAIVVGKVGGAEGRSACGQIVRRPANDQLLHAKPARDQVRRVIESADPYRHIDAFADQIDPPVGKADIEQQRRIVRT